MYNAVSRILLIIIALTVIGVTAAYAFGVIGGATRVNIQFTINRDTAYASPDGAYTMYSYSYKLHALHAKHPLRVTNITVTLETSAGVETLALQPVLVSDGKVDWVYTPSAPPPGGGDDYRQVSAYSASAPLASNAGGGSSGGSGSIVSSSTTITISGFPEIVNSGDTYTGLFTIVVHGNAYMLKSIQVTITLSDGANTYSVSASG